MPKVASLPVIEPYSPTTIGPEVDEDEEPSFLQLTAPAAAPNASSHARIIRGGHRRRMIISWLKSATVRRARHERGMASWPIHRTARPRRLYQSRYCAASDTPAHRF